ncbi:MAG: hypothetical protein S4CHLAM2_13220 [Chlamydiales bacterium]|nr:hypothetical protein [Chlamydiales bacterium]
MAKQTQLSIPWVKWPSLEAELLPHADFLYGTILNAGCGSRKIHFPRAEKVIGVDIFEAPNVDVVSDLASLPFKDQSFDGIVTIAVLEHCRYPWRVVEEFQRVIKDQGRVICTVPFLQPIHYVPTDYFRFTPDGIRSLFEDNQFDVIKIEMTHSVFHTTGWIGEEITKTLPRYWRPLTNTLGYLNRWLSRKCNTTNIDSLPNAVTLLAQRKPR